MCRYKCNSLTQQLLLFQTVEVTGHNMSVLVGRGSNLYFHFTDTFLSYITFSVFTQRGKCSLIKERIKVLEYKEALELHSEDCTCFNLVLELRPLFSGLLIKMTAEKDLSLSLCSVFIYTHSVSGSIQFSNGWGLSGRARSWFCCLPHGGASLCHLAGWCRWGQLWRFCSIANCLLCLLPLLYRGQILLQQAAVCTVCSIAAISEATTNGA